MICIPFFIMSEEWRPINGYKGLYEVSDKGFVRSLITDRLLKPMPDKGGYLVVNLYKNRKRKTCKVHRLVAAAFIPNPDNKPTVEHMDTDKTNNHVNNLYWATQSEQEQTKPCKGYTWNKRDGKWHARIKIPETGKHKSLGYFEREEDAAAAYIAAKYKYHLFWVFVQQQLKNRPRIKPKIVLKKKSIICKTIVNK